MSFPAKYNGVCSDCGGDIRKGQLIRFNDLTDGDVEHVVCPTLEGSRPPGETCPGCFIELPRTGVCEECSS